MPKDDLPPLTPLKSSALAGYAYDPNARVLTVEYASGAKYAYEDVGIEKVEAMQGNPSPGSYFAARIRNNFKARKL